MFSWFVISYSVSYLQVEVLVGPDKGKQGIIDSIITERNWCFVEGLNCVGIQD
jgi:ribosomal protein L24